MLLPITVVMVLVGVFRHNLMQLLEGKPKLLSPAAARERYVRARSPRHILTRAALLRANYATLPPRSVSTRQAFLARVLGDGSYLSPETRQAAARQQQPQPNELPDSPFNEAMMDGLMEQAKKSLVMMVPQTVIMGWINFFFTGFVLSTWRTDAVRLPFPLTQRFKLMLQRDVDTADLSVSWVSSLSWYFLNLYGLDAIYRLVLGNAQGTFPLPRELTQRPTRCATSPRSAAPPRSCSLARCPASRRTMGSSTRPRKTASR